MNVSAAQGDDQSIIREMLGLKTGAWNHADGPGWVEDFKDDCDLIKIRGDVFHVVAILVRASTPILHGRSFKGSHHLLSVRRFTLRLNCANRNRPRTDRFSGMVSGIALTAEGVLKTRMKYVGVKRND